MGRLSVKLVSKEKLNYLKRQNKLSFFDILIKDLMGWKMKKTRKEKKRLITISLIIMFMLVSLVTSVASDWTKILENKSKIESLNVKYNTLLSDEEKLVSEVTKLQDTDYIARYAKEKYMYSADGETIIRMD